MALVRRGTLTFGVVLIVIGIVLFLENWYDRFSVWQLVGRYWPLILVLVGLSKLYGHFAYKETPVVRGVAPKE